jgi:hypothetical protein
MREVFRSCVSFVWFILLPALAFGQTEVRVFVGGAVTEPVREAGATFARNSGSTLVYVTDTTGALQKRLAAGEKADLVIVAGPGMDMLINHIRMKGKSGGVIVAHRIDVLLDHLFHLFAHDVPNYVSKHSRERVAFEPFGCGVSARSHCIAAIVRAARDPSLESGWVLGTEFATGC